MVTLKEAIDKVIAIALKEIGTVESPAGSNKVKYNTWIYNKEVSGLQYPWCAAFVSWCFDQAGFPLGSIDYPKGYVGCYNAIHNVGKWGKIITSPRTGDVVFYDWEGDGKFDHTGIFKCDNANGINFTAIEGNTAVPTKGMDPKEAAKINSNGGAVIERHDRSYKNVIFVRPNCLPIQ